MTDIDSKKFACIIARTLDDKLGKNITILNISNVSSLADYFVIVTGDSTPQVKALMNNTKDKIKELFKRTPMRLENDAKNRWNLLDYGDVIVHILHKEERETYAIEKFWSNAYSISENEWKSFDGNVEALNARLGDDFFPAELVNTPVEPSGFVFQYDPLMKFAEGGNGDFDIEDLDVSQMKDYLEQRYEFQKFHFDVRQRIFRRAFQV